MHSACDPTNLFQRSPIIAQLADFNGVEMIKRTLKLSGHQTSVALEPEFWSAIDEYAKSKDLSWSNLVAQIDAQRDRSNLASTLRVAALSYYQKREIA